MARRSSTSTSGANNNVSASESGNAGEPEASSLPGEAALPAKKRKRGPNKTKPGTFTVRTEASLNQAEIRKLLTAHAAAMLGTDVAAKMSLQINVNGEWRALLDDPSSSSVLQFATVIEAVA